MRINRSLTRSAACITFSFLLLIAVFARPALAQSADDDTSPDSKTPVSKLSVSPTSLNFSVNIDKGVFDQTKSFKIKNGNDTAARKCKRAHRSGFRDNVRRQGIEHDSRQGKGEQRQHSGGSG